MSEKQMNTRIQHKIDIAENWDKAVNFIPLKGELIIYSDTKQFKIGDGIKTVINLPFFTSTVIAPEEGGLVFGDETSSATGSGAVAMGTGSTASGDGSVAMGDEVLAAGDGSFAQGGKIFRRGAEYAKNEDGLYYADPNGMYMQAYPEKCVDVATYPEDAPQLIVDEEGLYCYLHDVRYAEAHGYASMTAGQGAVAYARASKSLGYRTQTGYPTSPELAAARPEAITYEFNILNYNKEKSKINGDSSEAGINSVYEDSLTAIPSVELYYTVPRCTFTFKADYNSVDDSSVFNI